MPDEEHISVFQAKRGELAALAYRMTGSLAESEDIVQDAWLRFSRQDLATIACAPAWLRTTTMRLCLDHLRSARKRRESYVGAWLPDPLVQDTAPNAEQSWMLTEDVGVALVLTLHRLSPEMRAAFILRDAFDYGFDEIAGIVHRSPETCRQMVSRARRKLAGAAMPDTAPSDEGTRIAAAFWRASREGDMQALIDLFTEEIEVHTDGGGRVRASVNVLRGRERAARFFVGLARKWPAPAGGPDARIVNGSPGFLSRDHWGALQTTALDIANGRIRAIWIVRNPDKLKHVAIMPDPL